jgi:tetratricopeptide (TPR) repeat protein
MPLFAVAAAPLIAENFSLLASVRLQRICGAVMAAAMAIALLVWSPRPALNSLRTWDTYRFGLGMSGDYVPLGLPAFLDRIGFSGPVFNSQTLGGFYEYHGSPRRIPFYDFRLEDYDLTQLQQVFDATFTAQANPAGWQDLLRRYDFRGVLLEHSRSAEAGGLLPLLARDPAWRLVYLDYAASFWMRTDQLQLPPPVDRAVLQSLVAGINSAAQAENLDTFLATTASFPEVRTPLLEMAVSRWEDPVLLTNLGILKMQAGAYPEAEQLFKRVLVQKPDSRLTLSTLAQIALDRGDPATALTYLQRALKYFPADPDLRANYALVRQAAGK